MPAPPLPAFVISLADAAERRRRISESLGRAGIPFQFFDAVEGRRDYPRMRSPEGLDQAMARRYRGAVLSPPEVAVALSHRRVMRLALSLGHERVLILEDDAMPMANAAEALRVVPHLPEWVDLLYLGRQMYKDSRPVYRLANGSWLGLQDWGGAGQASYVITAAGMRRYLAACNRVDCNMDISTDQYWRHRVRVLDYRPFPFTLRRVESLLQAGREKVLPGTLEARVKARYPMAYRLLWRVLEGQSRRKLRRRLGVALMEPAAAFTRRIPV